MNGSATAAPEYAPQARAERLIAAGRLILGCFSLFAIYVDPATPAKYHTVAYGVLAGYSAYAAIVLVLTWRLPVPTRHQRLVSHVVDLILFSIFVYLTEGPASPFFLYFVFSLFCATLRFRWRGIVSTGAAALLIYTAISVGALLLGDPSFEWSRFVVRVSYLGVITALLSYLGIYQEQLRSELAALAAWPHGVVSGLDDILRRALPHVSTLIRSPRVLFVWEESEEPWVYAAMWSGGELTTGRAAPGQYDMGELHDASFLASAGDPPTAMILTGGVVSEAQSDPVGSRLRAEHGIETALGVTIESDSVTGRLFALDLNNATADDLVLAHIAGRLLLSSLEQHFFVQQARQTASAEERLRIARDLHDGVIQSLSGVGLQLASIHKDAATDLNAALERIQHVQRILEGEQRELRDLVRELRPVDLRRDGAADLDIRLRRIGERYLLEWGMAVTIPPPLTTPVPATAALEIYRIVNESLANAARHGGASSAVVDIDVADDAVRIRVADNGRGFDFSGRRDLRALETTGAGPKTLRERIVKLGGSLTIESAPGGAAVEAAFPLQKEMSRA
jgi:signal transduction histidine kinase